MIRATSSFINYIFMEKTLMSVAEVVDHLKKFRLIVKLPKLLKVRAALGLKPKKDGVNKMFFFRGGLISWGWKMKWAEWNCSQYAGNCLGTTLLQGVSKLHAAMLKIIVSLEDKRQLQRQEIWRKWREKNKWEDGMFPKQRKGVIWCNVSSGHFSWGRWCLNRGCSMTKVKRISAAKLDAILSVLMWEVAECKNPDWFSYCAWFERREYKQ